MSFAVLVERGLARYSQYIHLLPGNKEETLLHSGSTASVRAALGETMWRTLLDAHFLHV